MDDVWDPLTNEELDDIASREGLDLSTLRRVRATIFALERTQEELDRTQACFTQALEDIDIMAQEIHEADQQAPRGEVREQLCAVIEGDLVAIVGRNIDFLS